MKKLKENKKIIIVSILVFLVLISTTYFLINFSTKQDVIQGEFISKRGIMDKVSCVCFNSGYVLKDGIKTPVCIDSDLELKCKNIKLTGIYKSVNVEGDTNNCNLENYKIFLASGFEYLE